MTAVIGAGSGFWYAVVLIAAGLLLALGFLALDALCSLPDRWVSDVERCDRQRAAVNAALREGSERT